MSKYNINLLKEAAKLLKAKGLKIYQADWGRTGIGKTYFYFTDGKNIGYCQTEFGGLHFSSQHKPCKDHGTGYGLNTHPIYEINEEIIDRMIEKAFTDETPGYLIKLNNRPVPWGSWETFTRRNSYCKYFEMEL